jgi:hypothetical protein
MNRIHHIKQTLPANIRNNTDQNTNFLILDYHSSDGLQEYVTEFFSDELGTGRLQLYRYEQAEYFSHAHSRNMAVALSDAELVCNVDADNFTGKDFDVFLQSQFHQRGDCVVTALSNENKSYGAFGRMCTSKKAFQRVGGYDETFTGYGFEDYDLIRRLEASGLEKILINEESFLKTLPHGNTVRIAEQWNNKKFKRLYRQQLDEYCQVLLYLFSDGTLHYGILKEDLKAGEHFRYYLSGNAWQNGSWHEDNGKLYLAFDDFCAQFKIKNNHLIGYNHYLKIEDNNNRIEEALLFHTNMANCCRYINNKRQQRIIVNENGLGHGKVKRLLAPLKNIS